MNALPRGLLYAVLAGCASPCIGATESAVPRWEAEQRARVALDPAQQPLLGTGGALAAPVSVPDGYARIVSRHTGLDFTAAPQADAASALAAVCSERADLALALVLDPHSPLPCHDLTATRDFLHSTSLLAVRRGQAGPRQLHQLGAHDLLAVVDGGAYPAWLDEHYPGIRQLRLADMYTVLGAVEAGVATAAIGMDGVMMHLARGPFSTTLETHALDDPAPARLMLVAREQDRELIERINAGLDAATPADHARMMALWARIGGAASARSLFDTAIQRHGLLAGGALGAIALLLGVAWQLRRWQLQAVAESQHKSRFIGMMSHEVRNSAQAVMASIDLLGHSPLQQGQRDLVDAAGAAGIALRGLLNRAIDFARLSAGRFQPTARASDVQRVAEQALLAIAPSARAKGIALHLRTQPQPFPALQVDPDSLRQVLDNLLGNALRFTDTGSIEVALQLQATAADGGELCVDVVDTGVGIDSSQLQQLFRPFVQADAGRRRGGTGLGLSISRELARLMGGELSARSVEGHGSCFTLRVPARIATAIDAAPPPRPAPDALSGLAVMLVEDHDLNRAVVGEQLRQLGADVTTCADARSALDHLAGRPCDLVLLDIGLDGIDGMDGYQLATAIRTLESTQEQPPACIVALSADTSESHQTRCMAAGMDAALSKPLGLDALMALLGRLAPGRRPPPVPERDYRQAIAEELPGLLAAITQRDVAALRHRAHRLQGLAQMLGEPGWSAIAGDLWELADENTDWRDAQRLADVLASQQAGRQHPQAPPPD
ncbi:ATP-binding protein [Stenotrophomonas sp. 24(2023)]|uniref:ATP-binding protein n=1 Tax=Stenotrophomonas sp. 24(2023) TaxID=3068324 RepID=UPI0027E14354|nr:ATP-binding protein [Stenotrophomonas sp. 24(2023)]WMJ69173.1 ATP-binding protein [Stenotrophomonas sp. 24(2023)]